MIWQQKNELDYAIKDFTTGIRLEPLSAWAYICRGSTYSKRGDYENALADYTEAIRLDPRSVSAYNNIAWLRATCPDPHYRDGKAAVVQAGRACELTGGKQWECLATLAAAQAEKGDFKKAVKWQSQAIAMAPTDHEKHELDARLDHYKAHKPYHEVARRGSGSGNGSGHGGSSDRNRTRTAQRYN